MHSTAPLGFPWKYKCKFIIEARPDTRNFMNLFYVNTKLGARVRAIRFEVAQSTWTTETKLLVPYHLLEGLVTLAVTCLGQSATGGSSQLL